MAMDKIVMIVACVFFLTLGISQTGHSQSPASHTLIGTPKTVHWGYYSSRIDPVLKINAGDTVTITTPHGLASVYQAGGIPPEQISQNLKDIEKEVKDRGPGPHILTGPIFVNGAEPGDVLEVHIQEIKITAPFGYNTNWINMGALPEDFPYTAFRILKMDLEKMTTEPIPGVVIPLRPFFGSMGVAPPPQLGKISSAPPGVHGGNIDLKELVAGTILYLPVHVKGALFSVGDPHGVMGDGEVCLSALEAAEMKGTFKFTVRKNARILWPRAETPTHFITLGLNEDLDVAAKMAIREMINYLSEEKKMTREQAYMLCSLAVDFRVTQLVDGVKGIHAMLPKSILTKK